MQPGLIIGLAGSLIGASGPVVGTYYGIKEAREGAERRFVKQAALLMWLAVAGITTVLLLVASPYNWRLMIWYPLLAPMGVFLNRRFECLRREENNLST